MPKKIGKARFYINTVSSNNFSYNSAHTMNNKYNKIYITVMK